MLITLLRPTERNIRHPCRTGQILNHRKAADSVRI